MNTSLVPVVVTLVSLFGTSAFAQPTRDDFVIILDDVDVLNGEAVVAKVFRGQVLEVDEIRGDKLHLLEPARGWIEKRHATYSNTVAFDLFNEQVKKNPQDAGAFIARANSLVTDNKLEAAIKDFEEALRIDPKNSRAYANRGLCRSLSGEIDKAIADYTRAIELGSRNPVVYKNRAEAFVKKQDIDNAIADYTRTIELDSKNPLLYNRRARLFEKTHDNQKAIVDAEQLIRLFDDKDIVKRFRFWPNDDMYMLSARLHLGIDNDKAIERCNEAIKINPGVDNGFFVRGEAWVGKRDFKRAIDDFVHAIAMSPNRPDAHNDLAWLYATCPDETIRDGQKAITHATKACEASKWMNAREIETLAAAYAEAGDFKAAVKWQTKAIELVPKEANPNRQSRLNLYKAGKPYRDPPGK